MKINPMNGYIVVEINKEVETIRNGLYLGATSVTIPNTGKVVAVHKDSPQLKIGDEVMFIKHSGTGYKEDELNSESREFKVIKETEILGTIDAS